MSIETKPLKLYGRDADDVAVISAYLQDALVRPRDMRAVAVPKSFLIMASRFRWEVEAQNLRVRSAITIRNLIVAQSRGIEAIAPAPLSLLSLGFVAAEPPAGEVELVFSTNRAANNNDARLRLSVEALEITLEDVSESWAVKSRPNHAIDER